MATGQSQPLTLVQQIDPIYVDVTQSSDDYLRLKHEIASGAVDKEQGKVAVSPVTAENKDYTHKGYLEFSDVTVDETTGSITMRAVFPNPQESLLRACLSAPVWMKVCVLTPSWFRSKGLSVLQKAAQWLTWLTPKRNRSPSGHCRPAYGNKWLVTAGVNNGERVVVEGFQKIKQGAVVKATEVDLNAQPATAAPKETESAKSQ